MSLHEHNKNTREKLARVVMSEKKKTIKDI